MKSARKVVAAGKRAAAKVELTCKCLACGQSFTHMIPWFERHLYVCPTCGGDIDKEPLLQFTVSALKNAQATLKHRQTGLGSQSDSQ